MFVESEEGLTDEAPHDGGRTLLRALWAVRKAAYDHVRSLAETGVPSCREYCSVREPSAGVYFFYGTVRSVGAGIVG